MNVKKLMTLSASVLAAACALAVPRVDENTVTMEQSYDRTITVSMGASGALTMTIHTSQAEMSWQESLLTRKVRR